MSFSFSRRHFTQSWISQFLASFISFALSCSWYWRITKGPEFSGWWVHPENIQSTASDQRRTSPWNEAFRVFECGTRNSPFWSEIIVEFDLQRRMVAGEILDVSTFLENRISVSAGSDFFFFRRWRRMTLCFVRCH